jgi:hypothetical protein
MKGLINSSHPLQCSQSLAQFADAQSAMAMTSLEKTVSHYSDPALTYLLAENDSPILSAPFDCHLVLGKPLGQPISTRAH